MTTLKEYLRWVPFFRFPGGPGRIRIYDQADYDGIPIGLYSIIFRRMFLYQRLALPARAGIGRENHKTLNPLLGLNPESVGESPHLFGRRGGRRHFFLRFNQILSMPSI